MANLAPFGVLQDEHLTARGETRAIREKLACISVEALPVGHGAMLLFVDRSSAWSGHDKNT
jgi:hypothetical protein